jgi:filamentous hemagglutinin
VRLPKQKLIREQVASLTGYRFLGDYRSDEAQYMALMNAGATFAKAQQLRPGIALNAAQVAQLTSDMVWLVAQTVTLPDGSTTTALVPQVYLAPKTGDLAQNGQLFGGQGGGGAVISANEVRMALSGDVNNSGTIMGRKLVDISAQNISNSGLIQGDAALLSARDDINITGGQVRGTSAAVATAGGKLNVTTTTTTSQSGSSNTAGGNSFSHSGIDRVAGIYVSGSAGELLASAGGDINLTAAQLHNAGSGLTQISADGDVNLKTVDVGSSQNITWSANNYLRQSSSAEVGTQISGGGAVNISATQDVNLRAADVNAQGALNVNAGGNVLIEAGENSESLAEGRQSTSRGTFSSKTTTTRSNSESTTAKSSELGGQTVAITGGADTRIVGSNVLADQRLDINAGGNLSIEAAQNTQGGSDFNETKKSGLFGSGGIGFTIGKQQQSTDAQNTQTAAAASTVGAIAGDVNLSAGQTYTQRGSDVLAPGGDVNISAQRVTIEEARETASSQTEQKAKQSGLTVAVNVPIVQSAQALAKTVEAAGDTKSERMQLLGAATAALQAKELADQAAKLGDALAQGTDIRKAADISVSVSLGSSRSQSNSSQSSDSARGSSVTAGGDVNITAKGAGLQGEGRSDITVQGSQIKAGDTTRLSAEDEVRLLAAKNTQTETNSQSSKSGSVGLTFATTGISATASASRGQGQGAGNGTTFTNAQVSGQSVQIESGGDTTLQGAVVQGEQVGVNVGGNLTIESQQDSSRYQESSKTAGFSVSVPITGANASVSVNAGKTNINSNYQSVNEQSAIRAGDGGFQVSVAGNTTLTGGQITSSDKAVQEGRNTFSTAGQTASEALKSGALTLTNLNNNASFEASGVNIGVGVSRGEAKDPQGNTLRNPDGSAQTKTTPNNSAGFGQTDGAASSTTVAAISGMAGNAAARTGDAETGIKPIFNKDEVKQEVNAQIAITQEAGKHIPKAIGDQMGRKRDELKAQAEDADRAGDTEKAKTLRAEAQRYDEGGAYRNAAHTALGALVGGVDGALGAAASSAAAPTLNDIQSQLQSALQNAGMSAEASQQVASLSTGALAATLGATAGGTAGAATAFNADMNNRQLHPDERRKAAELAEQARKSGVRKPDGSAYTQADIEEQMRLMGFKGKPPATVEVLTTPQAIEKNLSDDPGMPKIVQGGVIVERPGQINLDLQRFIVANTNPEIPFGYTMSTSPAPRVTTTNAPTSAPTARCANGDLACITGVGQQQNAPLTQQTREAIADGAEKLSRQAGVIGAAATAATPNVPAQVRPITGAIGVGATAVSVAADAVEQLARPNTGKVVVDSAATIVQTAVEKIPGAGAVAPITNEVIEAWKNSGSAKTLEEWVNEKLRGEK